MTDQQAKEASKRRPSIAALVPLPLRNWQVVSSPTPPPIEIDGEATVVPTQPATTEAAADTSNPRARAAPSLEAADQMADQIVVTLEHRRQRIEAGATATYAVTLLNNGPERTHFALTIAEGQLASWLAEPIPGVMLQPGERATVVVSLTPPKNASSRAGEYRFSFVVTAAAYPDCQSQVTAALTIAPYVEIKIGRWLAPQRILTWWRRTVTLTLPLLNSGNQPTTIFLQAADGANACHVVFQAPGLRQMRQQQARLTLPPGRMTPITLQVYGASQSWFGRTPRVSPLQLSLTTKSTPALEQTTSIKLGLAPVIGPWQAATLFGFCALAVTGLGLGSLALFMALMVNLAQSATPVVPVNAPAPPAMVTILVQPAPATSYTQPATTGAAAVAPSPRVVTTTTSGEPEARNPAVPLVQPEQISAPSPRDSGQPATAPLAAQSVTYAHMFEEIARRYDLNWRMLAAQAYVESSFDALALGSHGTLGLMQIQPATWREWAPAVQASDPFDSYSNVLVAAVYLDYLRTILSKQGHPEREWMLAAYNWGPDKVLQHLQAGRQWEDLAPEIRNYVEEVLRLAETIPADAAF